MKISRRSAMMAGGLSIWSGLSASSAPTILTKKTQALRVLGTHVTLQEAIRKQAQSDLGINIQFQPGGSAAVLHQASMRPESFDLYEQWSNSIGILWQSGGIQAIDTDRIKHWNEINRYCKTGRLTDDSSPGAGDSPDKLIYIKPDGSLGGNESQQVSFMPYVHNVGAFGYNAKVVPRGVPYETESWAWLLDPQWAGRVATINEPTIGLFDLALAAQSKGLIRFADIGNITRDELDALFDLLIAYRQAGHFRGVWRSVPQSVKLMERGEACIESLFTHAALELRSRGVDCVYAAPREGYRAWVGVMCMASHVEGYVKDMAYDYMNWWLSGWPGAFLARQGYYISNPLRSRPHLSPAEWDYWYSGKPAREDLIGTDGQTVVRQGNIRDGGSYEQRVEHTAVWNSVMPSYEYSLLRWNEFLSG